MQSSTKQQRRNKRVLREQCKDREETGKTRDLFKKIGDSKGTFHAWMGLLNDRNFKDLIEAEEIKC